MNILMVTYITGTGNYPLYTADELTRLDNTVSMLPTDLNNQSKSFQKLFRKGRHLGHIGRGILYRQIHAHLSAHQIEVLLIYGSNYFLYPRSLRSIKKRGVKIVLFEGNLSFDQKFQLEAIPFYDLIITSDSYIVPFLRQIMGHTHVVYLTGWGVPSAFCPIEVTDDTKEKYGADVSFIGKWFANREEFLKNLNTSPKIWGGGWQHSSLPNKDEIKYLDPSKKSLVYCSSKINLHLKPGKQQINGFSTRIWEVPLCGGFILSEWSKDLLDLFTEDKEIVVFRSPGEADTKISYYLQREEERMRITERLREKIVGNYLLEHTVAKINELLLKL
jgi:hypothetical protein